MKESKRYRNEKSEWKRSGRIIWRIRDIVKQIGGWVLQLLYPRRCPICDDIVRPFGEKICCACLQKLKVIGPNFCLCCGKKLLIQGEKCSDCKGREHVFERGRALYSYESVALSVYRFKYGGRREYGQFYGEQMADFLGDFIKRVKPDGLIPIPLHKKRLSDRGYNQAEILARVIGKRLNIPVYTRILARKKNTAPLKYENPIERQNNLKNAFIMLQNDVKLKRVVIVDDIYTTGSTMDAAARTLKSRGVTEVYFVALAGGEGL